MTNTNINSQSSAENEYSLKDLMLILKEWITYLIRNWKIIILVGIIGAALGIGYAFYKKTRYFGELTFVIESSKPGGLGAYAGLASQFGLDLGEGSGSGVFTGDNIIEFLRSRLMVEKALLTSMEVEGKQITLAENYLEFSGLRKKLNKKPALQNLHFAGNIPREKFSLQQDSVLNIIYTKILTENLNVYKPNKKLLFVSVQCTSLDEKFSKVFIERLVKEATEFYIQTKLQRSKANVDKLQLRADSLEIMLNRKTYSVAASQDLNLNPARRVATVNSEVITRDKMVLQTMYGEVVKNLEISKMSMAQEMPIIQIVDTPIYPLLEDKPGKIKLFLLGGILGAFLIIAILIIRKLYNDIIK